MLQQQLFKKEKNPDFIGTAQELRAGAGDMV